MTAPLRQVIPKPLGLEEDGFLYRGLLSGVSVHQV